MARYIDADLLKEDIIGAKLITKPQFLNTVEAMDIINLQPTADVEEVKHGQWNENGIAYECSLCGASLVVEQGTADMNYCPNCGAKMDSTPKERGGEK